MICQSFAVKILLFSAPWSYRLVLLRYCSHSCSSGLKKTRSTFLLKQQSGKMNAVLPLTLLVNCWFCLDLKDQLQQWWALQHKDRWWPVLCDKGSHQGTKVIQDISLMLFLKSKINLVLVWGSKASNLKKRHFSRHVESLLFLKVTMVKLLCFTETGKMSRRCLYPFSGLL